MGGHQCTPWIHRGMFFVWDVGVMSVSVASRFLLYFHILMLFSIICFCVVRSWRWNPCASWAVMSIRLLRKRTSKAGLAWCNWRRWDFPFRLQKCWVSAIQSNLCKQDISGQNCNSNVPGIVNAARLAHCQHPCSKTASKQCCTDYLIFSSHQLSIVPNFKTHKGRECTPAMWIVNYEGVFGLLWSFYFSNSALCFLHNWFLWVVEPVMCVHRRARSTISTKLKNTLRVPGIWQDHCDWSNIWDDLDGAWWSFRAQFWVGFQMKFQDGMMGWVAVGSFLNTFSFFFLGHLYGCFQK